MTVGQMPESHRIEGLLVGAAVGDALGWPQENRSNIVGGQKARRVDPALRFTDWERNSGSQYARYRERIRAGEYSDDTQLLMAVARACLHDADWLDWLTRIELPLWPLYQRGGGAAVLRSAKAWSDGRPPWLVTSRKAQDRAATYFEAGANGVAMRIAPHAVVTAHDSTPHDLLERIIRDGISTHGHPRALVGACVHGLALRNALRHQGTLGYGDLMEAVLSDSLWQETTMFTSCVPDSWLAAYRENLPYQDVVAVWRETVHEMRQLLTLAMDALAAGAMASDERTLEKMGVFGRYGGSGTITAAATLYIAVRTAARPHSGLLRSAFLTSADTDTLASMTGAILGAVHGTQWLGGLENRVQDRGYLTTLAEQLSVKSSYRAAPQARIERAPEGLTAAALRRYTDVLFEQPGYAPRFPDGRDVRVLEEQRLPTNARSLVEQVRLETSDGQTLTINRVTRGRRTEPAAGTTSTFAKDGVPIVEERRPSESEGARVVATNLLVENLERSVAFYSRIFHCSVERLDRKTARLMPGLLVTESAEARHVSLSRGVRLEIGVESLRAVEQRVAREGVAFTRHPTGLRLRDPDGYDVLAVAGLQPLGYPQCSDELRR